MILSSGRSKGAMGALAPYYPRSQIAAKEEDEEKRGRRRRKSGWGGGSQR
jgi:hypothetical protein